MATLRIIGIDPGTRRLGFGVIEVQGTRHIPLGHGVVDVTKIDDFPERLETIHNELNAIVAEFSPSEASIEEVFAGRNVKSALRSAEGRGAVLLTLRMAKLDIHEYATRVVKRSVTGRGNATKDQVQEMVTRMLALKTRPSEDASDALAMALCHAQRRKGIVNG